MRQIQPEAFTSVRISERNAAATACQCIAIVRSQLRLGHVSFLSLFAVLGNGGLIELSILQAVEICLLDKRQL